MQASFTSPIIQNELIDIIGQSIMQSIVNDVKKAGWYIIIEDDTTLHNTQYITIGVRYVHQEKKKIKEDAFIFKALEKATAEAIMETIKAAFKQVDLSFGRYHIPTQYTRTYIHYIHI